MIPGIILGVLSFVALYALKTLGLIEYDHSDVSGLLAFDVAPFLGVASIISVRIVRLSRKNQPDVNSSIATLLCYSAFSLLYIMIWAWIIQHNPQNGPFVTDLVFAGIEIFLGLSVCWLTYWIVMLCKSVLCHVSRAACIKMLLRSSGKAFILFAVFNVLPLYISLFCWPLLIMAACKIVSLFA
jgi:hypothetical protein